jgi:hypothetical protein
VHVVLVVEGVFVVVIGFIVLVLLVSMVELVDRVGGTRVVQAA